VSSTEPHVVVVTDSPALVIGLTCLPTGWHLVCRPAASGAAELAQDDADVLVLDLGDTDAGLELLTSADALVPPPDGGRPTGVVVLGDGAPGQALPLGVEVLLRPYTLTDLQQVIGALLPAASADDGDDDGSVLAVPAEEGVGVADSGVEVVDDGAARPAPSPPETRERVIDLTAPSGPADHDAPRRQRWFARSRPQPSEAEGRFRARVAAVLAATAELERLLDEFPPLASVDGFGRAVVGDLATRLTADTVAYWRWYEDGWKVLAQRGLTRLEASWVVPHDHPLFAEIDAAGGALLIDPVDAAQAAVAGIGGAHTESFMAAALAVGPGRFGILAVGRNRPLSEADLETLVEEAAEAAPGMALAEQLTWLVRLTTGEIVAEEAASHT
jgi:hypothetical protein